MRNNCNVIKVFLQGFTYSFGVNILSLIIRTTYVFILPKFLSVVDFGYWQLYFLYSGFIHFCHLGLVDGVYLKNGGLLYSELDKKTLTPQFWILLLQGCIFAILIYSSALTIVDDKNKLYILFIVAIDIVLMLPRTLLSVIFQATGMIRQFSLSLLSQEVVGFFGVVIFLFYGVRDFKTIIITDCFARIVSLGLSISFVPELLKVTKLYIEDFKEAYSNVKIGIFLLMANMASMVILAIIRIAIEQRWGIAVFSKISLAFSMANICLVAFGAASVVLFPILKRLDNDSLSEIYGLVKKGIVLCLTLLLVFYYPCVYVLKLWLPQYVDSLRYLGLLAPLCLFESQLVLLCNNFLKVIREEKVIFKVNILAIVLALCVGLMILYTDLELEILLLGVIFIPIAKVWVSEKFLSIKIKFSCNRISCISIFTTFVFILTAFYLSDTLGFLFYLIYIMCFYPIIKKFYYEIRNSELTK